MKFIAEVKVMPLKDILDPQGNVVAQSIRNLGLKEIQGVHIGKHILLELDAANESIAHDKVDQACKQLLANRITENYTFELRALSN